MAVVSSNLLTINNQLYADLVTQISPYFIDCTFVYLLMILHKMLFIPYYNPLQRQKLK